MPNNVLVTGASGLLGVAAIEKFLSAGWDVGVSLNKIVPSGNTFVFLYFSYDPGVVIKVRCEKTGLSQDIYERVHCFIPVLTALY
jgi:hypothetical protein